MKTQRTVVFEFSKRKDPATEDAILDMIARGVVEMMKEDERKGVKLDAAL